MQPTLPINESRLRWVECARDFLATILVPATITVAQANMQRLPAPPSLKPQRVIAESVSIGRDCRSMLRNFVVSREPGSLSALVEHREMQNMSPEFHAASLTSERSVIVTI
jgi:hypothetical protein